jgi:hypothetical protein
MTARKTTKKETPVAKLKKLIKSEWGIMLFLIAVAMIAGAALTQL